MYIGILKARAAARAPAGPRPNPKKTKGQARGGHQHLGVLLGLPSIHRWLNRPMAGPGTPSEQRKSAPRGVRKDGRSIAAGCRYPPAPTALCTARGWRMEQGDPSFWLPPATRSVIGRGRPLIGGGALEAWGWVRSRPPPPKGETRCEQWRADKKEICGEALLRSFSFVRRSLAASGYKLKDLRSPLRFWVFGVPFAS